MSTGGTDHDPLSPSSEKPQASLLPSQTAEATLGAGHLPQTEEGRRTTMDRAEVKATARPSQQLPQDDGKLKKKKRTVVLKPTVRGSLSPSPVGQADAPEDIEAVGTADELLGLLSGLAERQKQLETRLEGWVDKQCDGMLRQDQLLSELLNHLSAKSMIGMEERRHISDTRRRYFPDAKGKPILPRAASDGEMGGRAGRPMARAMSKDWEERARLKEKPEVAMLPIPEKPDQQHSVSFGGIHQDTVEIDAETDMTGKMSSVRAGKTTRAASRVSKGSAANKVAQIKTIRCSVEREEAFSQLRQNQMGERYGKKGTFGSREKIIATVTVAVHSAWLERCTLMFTVLSAVLVGWEVDRGVESGADMHFALVFFKHLTTFVFLLEIAARITAQGKEFFNPDGDDIGWHILEVIMVAAGLIEFIVDCAGLAGQAGFLVVVRIGRAARLLRIHRVLHQVPALRMIYHSMLATTRSLFWAIAMLLIVIYCFAIVFQQAVNDYTGSQSQDAVSETFGLFFPSILRTALTLMQACTGGLAWADVERSLAEIHWIWVVMFGLYFCLVYFALMNVVTAVFCSSAVERANQDQEAAILDELQKESQYTESLQNLFASMDSNDDGKVSILEFEEKFADPRIEALFSSMGIDEDKAWKIFEILDLDSTGDISPQEFVSQGLRLKGNALRIDVERTYAALKRQNFMMEELHEQMGELQGLCQTLSENAAASTRTNPASAYLA